MFALITSLLHHTAHIIKLVLSIANIESTSLMIPVNTYITYVQNTHSYELLTQNNTVYNLSLFETSNYNFITSTSTVYDNNSNTNPFSSRITYTISDNNVETDSETESYDSDYLQQEIVEEIEEEEESFIESEKQTDCYYLGIPFLYNNDTTQPDLLLHMAIQPSTFLKYNMYYINKYINSFQLFSHQFNLEIIKLERVTTNIENTD